MWICVAAIRHKFPGWYPVELTLRGPRRYIYCSGSSLFLSLPAVVAGSKGSTLSPQSHLHGGAHIVVADRDPGLLDLMVATLRQADHCVFRAYDGISALELALHLRNIDLLITNTNMPGLNGPQLIRRVREFLGATT